MAKVVYMEPVNDEDNRKLMKKNHKHVDNKTLSAKKRKIEWCCHEIWMGTRKQVAIQKAIIKKNLEEKEEAMEAAWQGNL